jgi:hypothetical protein
MYILMYVLCVCVCMYVCVTRGRRGTDGHAKLCGTNRVLGPLDFKMARRHIPRQGHGGLAHSLVVQDLADGAASDEQIDRKFVYRCGNDAACNVYPGLIGLGKK